MAYPPKTAQDIIDDANRGIVGIDREGEVFGGYDDIYPEAGNGPMDDAYEEREPLPPAERVALADEMIRRWTAYRAAAEAATSPARAAGP